MSNSDIEERIREVYNFEVLIYTIFRITEKVTRKYHGLTEPSIRTGVSYSVDGLDHIQRTEEFQGDQQTVGLRKDGKKEVSELWQDKNESVTFCISVLTDINPERPRIT
uniref:hypothetical protein n=1 Tax=Mesonia aquimarina TaxID=1504967 RepID=UPI001F09686C|nr:hypothetical protein [Mesonia aquimarina]